MESINVQIEPSKTYFSDGCVETVEADETDLLRGESKIDSDEPVGVKFKLFIIYCLHFTHYFIFLE